MVKGSAFSPTLLSIAGSDPSGGAGIQADLKTMTSIGVYGAAAITCLTVQNSCGVQEIHSLPPDFVRKQVEAVLVDHNVTHIKIGMLGTAGIMETVGEMLASFAGVIVYDPVLASSTGESLFQKEGLPSLQKHLLSRVTILTPNREELELLTNTRVNTTREAVAAAEILLETYPSLQAVVVKGGHLKTESATIHDFLVGRDTTLHESKRKRRECRNLHGTGCTYASALASYLCLGHDLAPAFQLAGNYMDQIIQAGIGDSAVKSGSNGPLFHYRFSS